MPKKVIITTKEDLESVVTPADVASHKYVMDQMAAQLAAAGLTVKKESFYKNLNGEMATGIYVIDSPQDMVISWTNTYDKTMRFKCNIGAYSTDADAYMIAEGPKPLKLNQPDKSEVKTLATIKHAIASANAEYNGLLVDAATMATYTLDEDQLATLLGKLYFYDAITSSQLIKVKDACKKDVRNLLEVYKKIVATLKGSHPKSWASQQQLVHKSFLMQAADLNTPSLEVAETVEEVDPNQTNLLEQIDEVSTDIVVEDAPTLSLDDHPANKQPEVKVQAPENVVTVNETTDTAADLLAAAPSEMPADLNTSDADDIQPEDKVQDQEALSLDKHNPEFPAPPADLPVSGAEEVAVPLEEQVATEFVAPVSVEEEVISAPVIVDEPVIDPVAHVENDLEYAERVASIDKEPTEQEKADEEMLKKGPTPDPIFDPEPKEEVKEVVNNNANIDPWQF